MINDELKAQRSAVGAKYADLVRQLLDARVEIQALEHVISSPIANGHGEPGGFNAGVDINDLPNLLAHKVFSAHASRHLSGEVNERVKELAESLRTAAA